MPDTFYAECEYCGPLPVSGDASPETANQDHAFDATDAHVERNPDHTVKVWQLVDIWPKRPCCAYHASSNTAIYGRPCGRVIDGRA